MRLAAPISPWGGLSQETGAIREAGHPDDGISLAGRIVAMPGLKGSTAAPGALLELIASGLSPQAFITPEPETGLIAAVTTSQLICAKVPVIAWGDLPAVQSGPVFCQLV